MELLRVEVSVVRRYRDRQRGRRTRPSCSPTEAGLTIPGSFGTRNLKSGSALAGKDYAPLHWGASENGRPDCGQWGPVDQIKSWRGEMTEVVCFTDDVQTSAVVISGSQVLRNQGDLPRNPGVQQIAQL